MKKLFIILLLGILMTSCRSSKAVYNIGNGWKPAPKTSTMTGWVLKTK
jgi:hypothetical protein